MNPNIPGSEILHKLLMMLNPPSGFQIYFLLFFLVVGAYLVWSVVLYWKNNGKYLEFIWKIRKTYYVICVLMFGVGLALEIIEISDWKLNVQMAGVVVFIDIVIFQTPSITKFFNAEFQHQPRIEQILGDNLEFIHATAIKLQEFSNVIKKTNHYFEQIPEVPRGESQYLRELKKYLTEYTRNFRYRIDFFSYNIYENDPQKTRESIENAFARFETLSLIKVDDHVPGGKKKNDEIITKLLNFESCVIIPGKLLLIPLVQASHYFILSVRSTEGAVVDESDIVHIANLARIFDWYMS